MFNPVLNPFSRYADKTEKKLDSLLNKTAFLSKAETSKKLLQLMQYNLVAVNLWLEKRFKGYKYLSRSRRKIFYRNTVRIVQEFSAFESSFRPDPSALATHPRHFGYTPSSREKTERIRYIFAIMNFLKPGRHYTYLEGASFGKLLADITSSKMIGDCNQIVTFYAFLYSQRYDLDDLKIKLLPGHVCLHFDGIDIEATAGAFNIYKNYESILPLVELITTNLLDTSDFRDKQLKIDGRSYVKAAELAHRLSSHNELVNRNLVTAYRNLAIESARDKDFAAAKFFLDKIGDIELAANIFENAAIHFTENKDFKKALYYAGMARKPELEKYVRSREGWNYFNNGNYDQALVIYKNIQDAKMVKACYAELYNAVQKKVAGITDPSIHRLHKNDYNKMIDLAGKMEDWDLQSKLKKFIASLD